VGPGERDIKHLSPFQVITDGYAGGFGLVSLRPPAPAKLGATLVLNLWDFQWSESLLRQDAIEVRLVQWLDGPGLETPGPIAIRSPMLQLDGRTVRKFLENYPQTEGITLTKRLSDGSTIKTEKSSSDNITVEPLEQLHVVSPSGQDIFVGIRPTWFFDATEESDWISAIYKDAKYTLCVATFRIQGGKAVDLSSTAIEKFGAGDVLQDVYFAFGRPDDMICMRTGPDDKFHYDEWRFSMNKGLPIWSQVDTTRGLEHW
jgi:hypothetical protein